MAGIGYETNPKYSLKVRINGQNYYFDANLRRTEKPKKLPLEVIDALTELFVSKKELILFLQEKLNLPEVDLNSTEVEVRYHSKSGAISLRTPIYASEKVLSTEEIVTILVGPRTSLVNNTLTLVSNDIAYMIETIFSDEERVRAELMHDYFNNYYLGRRKFTIAYIKAKRNIDNNYSR